MSEKYEDIPEIREMILEQLPKRISARYKKVSRPEATFHALSDLWRIFNNVQMTPDISDFFSTIVHGDGELEKFKLPENAVNDLISACLLYRYISPSTGRKIRKVLFGHENLQGVVRGDLYDPGDEVENNPVWQMIYLGGMYPGIYAYLRIQRNTKNQKTISGELDDTGWSRECFVPVSIVNTILLETYCCFALALELTYSEPLAKRDIDKFVIKASPDTVQLAQYSSWQNCPITLDFDPTLISLLSNSSATDKIPRDILCNLPYWSVCVKTPGFIIEGDEINFMMLSFNSCATTPVSGLPDTFSELKIIVYADSTRGWISTPITFPLYLDSVDSQLKKTKERSKSYTGQVPKALDQVDRAHEEILKMGVQIALYLSSKEPDYSGRHPDEKYSRKAHVMRTPPEKLPHEFPVGKTVASSLKKLEETHGSVFEGTATHGSVRPHWRKAHWHLYWKGKGRNQPVVHWIAPTPINVSPGVKLPTTERRVSVEAKGDVSNIFYFPGQDPEK